MFGMCIDKIKMAIYDQLVWPVLILTERFSNLELSLVLFSLDGWLENDDVIMTSSAMN